MMLRIAADYERLAERTELRAQGASTQRPKGSSPATTRAVEAAYARDNANTPT